MGNEVIFLKYKQLLQIDKKKCEPLKGKIRVKGHDHANHKRRNTMTKKSEKNVTPLIIS